MLRLGTGDLLSSGGPLQLSSQRLSEGVYERLVNDIYTGVLRPGDPLRDRDVAERLGVSRTPVREAIQRLERTGLLDVWPGRQTKVRDLTPDDVTSLYEYFGEVSAIHVGFGMTAIAERSADCTDVREGAAGLSTASDAEWGAAFVTFMAAVAACEGTLRGRLLEDHLPLMSLVLRHLPDAVGGRQQLSADVRDAIDAGDTAAATGAVRGLFGLDPR